MALTPDRDALAEAIGGFPVFEHLPRAARRELAGAARLLACDQRTRLLASGDWHRSLFMAIEGQIDLCGSSSDGEEVTLATLGPGQASSWVAIYHTSAARRDLVATAGAKVLAIPHDFIRSLLERYPALFPHILAMEGSRFRALLDWQQQSLVSNRERRVALLLLLLVQLSGETGEQPLVRLSGERLARSAQCSRQTLMTALRKLQAAGWIHQGYGKVQLLDVPKLRAFAEDQDQRPKS